MGKHQNNRSDFPDFSRRNLLKLAGAAAALGPLGLLVPERAFASGGRMLVLYYSKKPEELQPGFITNVLGSAVPLTAKDQKTTFQSVISETLGEDCDYEVVRNIHENLNEMLEEAKETPEPLELSRPDVRRLLERSGAPEEKLASFDREFEETVGEKNTLLASNIASVRSFQVETPDVIVKVNPERSDLVEIREIDGRRCLVIAVDDHLEVNGIEVRK